MLKSFILPIILFFHAGFVWGQTVTHAACRQEQQNIIVSYNLETRTPCKINLYLSRNGGETWDGPLKKVEGDVGENISSGYHQITWSVLDEFEALQGKDIKFQVRATNDIINSVIIGEQQWSSSNLNVTHYRNGDKIPQVQDPNLWLNLTTGAWCYYENKSENGITYGKLYNWYAVNDSRGLAPEGWHVPTDAEWNKLVKYLGDKLAGEKLKSKAGWKDNGNGTNSSKFGGLPGGCYAYGSFFYKEESGFWWSADDDNLKLQAWYLCLKNSNEIGRFSYSKNAGFSVRVVKD